MIRECGEQDTFTQDVKEERNFPSFTYFVGFYAKKPSTKLCKITSNLIWNSFFVNTALMFEIK